MSAFEYALVNLERGFQSEHTTKVRDARIILLAALYLIRLLYSTTSVIEERVLDPRYNLSYAQILQEHVFVVTWMIYFQYG